MPSMPMLNPDFEAGRRDYMMVLFGALCASGVPAEDARHLAAAIACHVTGRFRENIGREADSA